MEKLFVEAWDKSSQKIRDRFSIKGPGDYQEIVKAVVEIASEGKEYDVPDPERIHVIDDGDYQGTQVFVVAEKGYQPSRYWYATNYYGSCSGCDTLEHINSLSYEEKPTKDQVDQWMALALHIVQRIKPMDSQD